MNEAIQINIARIIEQKTGRKLPLGVAPLLRRLIHEREINDILVRHADKQGASFLDALQQEFALDTRWLNPEALPQDRRVIFACNHPLGGLDGISLAHLLCQHYGDVRYMVSELLYNLKPLQSVFLPVNNYGAQKREQITLLQQAMQSDVPIGTFPAGYCSRHIQGKIQDIDWHRSFISLAKTYQRDIIPLFFVGQNSRHFYLIDRVRKALGIKFDLCTALLPDEMFRGKGKCFRVIVGQAIPWKDLPETPQKAKAFACEIRKQSYALPELYAEQLSKEEFKLS